MAIDLRQQILIELQTRGADALSVLAQAFEEVNAEIAKTAKAFLDEDASATKTISTIENLSRTLGKLRDLEAAATQANDEMVQSVEKIDVGWAKLVVSGLKLQDTIRKVGENTAKIAKESPDDLIQVDVALNKLIVDGFKFTDRLREAMVSLDQLAASAQKLRSDRIDQMATSAQNAHQAFLATVISTDSLAASAQKLRSDHVVQFYRNTEILKQELEATLIPLNQVIMSGLNMQGPTQSMGGFASASQEAANKTQRMGYAMMNFSYLAQDMQYGMAAVANNIGIVSMSIGEAIPKFAAATAIVGGPAGFGAILMGLGVGISLVVDNWDSLKASMSGGLPPKMHDDVKDLQEKLKDLESIKVKTNVDYRNIIDARKELAKLSEEESTYNAMKGKKTKEQQKRSEIIQEAIVEGGGATDYDSGVENISKVVALIMRQEASGITDLEKYINERKRRLSDPHADPASSSRWASELRGAQGELAARDDAIRQQAAELVGGAGAGRQDRVQALGRMLGAHEAKFAAQGVDVSRLGAGFEMASPANLFADEREKHQKEIEKREDDLAKADRDAKAKARDDLDKVEDKRKKDADTARKQADTAHGRAVNTAVQRTQDAWDDKLEATIYKNIKAGKGAKLLSGREDIVTGLKARDVPDAIVNEVADRIIAKATEEAQNDIASGEKPKLIRQADTASRVAAAKEKREAPKLADQKREARLAQGFQRLNRDATPEQSAYAAHQMDTMIQQGKTPQQAYSTVREKMLKEIMELNRNIIEMRAQQEQDSGFFGQASMMLMQLNTKIGAMGKNQNSLQTQGQKGQRNFQGGG